MVIGRSFAKDNCAPTECREVKKVARVTARLMRQSYIRMTLRITYECSAMCVIMDEVSHNPPRFRACWHADLLTCLLSMSLKRSSERLGLRP